MAYRKIDLIYCANGNGRFAQIAIEHGYTYGAQLPGTVYFPPEFVDQDWKNPDRERYMTALAEHRPRMASVLDWEYDGQLPEVLAWAEDAAAFVDTVIIIPKVHNGIARLPRKIASAEVRLGYSVPTNHGGTEVTAFEFLGWPLHLLGGSPGQQMKLATTGLNVVSADGNMTQMLAIRHCKFWQPGKRPFANAWPSLKEAGGGVLWGDGSDKADAPYEAFRRSCKNIMAAWENMS
jgi:hypothetical protein